MKNRFQFHMPTDIIFESQAAYHAADYINGERVLIICDPFLFQNGVAKKVGDSLTGKTVRYFSDIEPNPSCECVDAAALLAREADAQCVIGMGGGSSLDVAKIVSCLISNPGSIYDYYGGGTKTLSPRQAQLICIPTTAGTGSEVTNVGVYTNRTTGKKVPMVSNLFWADIALIDSTLTHTLPPHVTAATGMDAFCHAIEAYWNEQSQPMCDMLALRAMQLILTNIRTAYDFPEDASARSAMSQASVLAGVAFSQTRTTGIHALSFPLTVDFGLSHGEACSITLPAFIRISPEKQAEKMAALIAYLGFESIDIFAQHVEDLMSGMGMKVRLHQAGVSEADLSRIADIGLEAAIIHLSPAKMDKQSVMTLLRSIL